MDIDKASQSELYRLLQQENFELQKKYDELLEKYKKLSERENLFMVDSEQCKGITKKGYRCGQKGLPNQGGGHIIHGYCEWHR